MSPGDPLTQEVSRGSASPTGTKTAADSSLLLLQDFAAVAEGSRWGPGPGSAPILFVRRRPAEAPPLPRVSGAAAEPGVLPRYQRAFSPCFRRQDESCE